MKNAGGDSRANSPNSKAKSKLEDLRIQLAKTSGRKDLEEFRKLKQEVRKSEILEKSIARRRNRLLWLKEGNAPTKFFFPTVENKQAKQAMTMLETETGEMMEDEGRILINIVTSFMVTLFRKQPEIEEAREKRDGILRLSWRSVFQDGVVLLGDRRVRAKGDLTLNKTSANESGETPPEK
ncbi:hypothetical protein R1flu_014163 [Riccia fluitans]|uniref:Uncharacterized protein n=1 Tax=Riccia fluitans TaxID=41844 RepID=A0ABD1YFG3_9MARC